MTKYIHRPTVCYLYYRGWDLDLRRDTDEYGRPDPFWYGRNDVTGNWIIVPNLDAAREVINIYSKIL